MAIKIEIKATELSKEQLSSIKRIKKYLTGFLAEQAGSIADAIGAAYAESQKKSDSEKKADKIIKAVDLEEWEVVAEELQDDLGGAFEQTAQLVLGKLDISDQDIFDLVNERAVAYAEESGAELVTEITEATRSRLRKLVSNAIENADGVNELKAAIREDYAFSPARAETIARTEIGNAHMEGALEGAKASGLEMKKAVLRGSQDFDCDICGDNEDAGDVELDEEFPSGDEAPLFHPNCECTMVFHVAKDAEAA